MMGHVLHIEDWRVHGGNLTRQGFWAYCECGWVGTEVIEQIHEDGLKQAREQFFEHLEKLTGTK